MMTLDEDEIRSGIALIVGSGFDAEARVLEIMLEEYFDPKDLTADDRDFIEREVRRAFAEKRARDATLPAQTRWDRLAEVFEGLVLDDSIVALHDAGFTQSDGLGDVDEVWRASGGPASGLAGYVFYHRQDVERAIEESRLYLNFGAFDDTADTAVRIARQILAKLRAAGIEAEWPDDPGQRIHLPRFAWQKHSPDE